MRTLVTIFVFFFLLPGPVQVFAAEALMLENAWIRQPPPGASATAGYMTIRNTSDDDYYITAVESSAFGAIELHESIEEDGMAKMIHHNFYKVPARSVFEIKPGSYHLMMFRWQDQLKDGDLIPFEVKLGNGDSLTIDAVVKHPQ